MTKPLLKGVLKTWKEDRGFGFITPDNGGRDLFIHISALGQPSRRPVPGDVVHYQVARDRHGKLRAINANIDGITSKPATTRAEAKERSLWLAYTLISLVLMGIGIAVFYWKSGNLI